MPDAVLTESSLAASSPTARFFSSRELEPSRQASRLCVPLLMAVLAAQVVLLNTAPQNPFFALTLQAWEQGRFIHFHGLAQWVGWLWPYAAFVYLIGRVGQTGGR